MSEQSSGDSNRDDAEEQQGSEVIAADEASDAEFESPPSDDKPRSPRSATFTALLALLVAVLSFVGMGYLWIADDEPVVAAVDDNQLDELRTALRSAESSVASLEREVTALRREASNSSVDVPGIERRLEQRVNQRLDTLETVPARIESIEDTLTALRGVSTGARDAWLIAEAEYYLQLANAQARLAANASLANLALRLADERLREVGDPGLIAIRRVVAEEMRSLDVLEQPDTESAALTLTSLAKVVDALPIRQDIVVAGAEGERTDDSLTGTARAVDSLKRAMSGIVRVRRTDESAKPLLAPDAAYFLRTNLTLQLQTARLALLRGEQTLFEQSLDDAAAWLREYYDNESAPVRNALATIDDVRAGSVAQTLPDISESLRLLRNYSAFIEASDAPSQPEPRPQPAREPAPQATPTPDPAPPADAAPESAPEPEPDPEPAAEPVEPDPASEPAAETLETEPAPEPPNP